MVTKERKQELVETFGANAQDTGSTAVQIAILTEEINLLNGHMKINKKDVHSKRGLLKKVAQRKSLQRYLAKKDLEKYQDTISKLGLRR